MRGNDYAKYLMSEYITFPWSHPEQEALFKRSRAVDGRRCRRRAERRRRPRTPQRSQYDLSQKENPLALGKSISLHSQAHGTCSRVVFFDWFALIRISRTVYLFLGVFWILPLVGVRRCLSRVVGLSLNPLRQK